MAFLDTDPHVAISAASLEEQKPHIQLAVFGNRIKGIEVTGTIHMVPFRSLLCPAAAVPLSSLTVHLLLVSDMLHLYCGCSLNPRAIFSIWKTCLWEVIVGRVPNGPPPQAISS